MSERKIANNHYPGLDVVRVIAIAGIVLMHVLANGNYDLSGFLFEKVIGTAGNFTILFMMVSAFGMCCGYYEKFKAGTINIEAFYKRRYEKLWPFFALLCILDGLVNHSAKYFMPVYVLHTIVAAGVRTVLLKIGISSGLLHFMIGFSVSVFVPVVIYMIAEKQWWLLFWFEPIKAMKLRNQKK